MADPIGVRNVLVQTSAVEKIQQVQQQQGDMHQRYMAHQNPDELERKNREVQTSQETSEARIRRENENKGKREEKKRQASAEEMDTLPNREDREKNPEGKLDETGLIIDIKV